MATPIAGTATREWIIDHTGGRRIPLKKKYEAIYRRVWDKPFPKKATHDDVVRLMGTLYMLKLKGIESLQDLYFTWYKRGPYCFEVFGR